MRELHRISQTNRIGKGIGDAPVDVEQCAASTDLHSWWRPCDPLREKS